MELHRQRSFRHVELNNCMSWHRLRQRMDIVYGDANEKGKGYHVEVMESEGKTR